MPELSLSAKLRLDKRDFDKGIKSAESDAGRFGDSFSRRLGKPFAGAAIATTIAAIGMEAVQSAKSIDEIAGKLRITAEEAHRLKLEDALKSGAGNGNIFFDDKDLENLRIVERLFIKVKDLAVTAAGKVPFLFNSSYGAIVGLAKLTGFVSSEKPNRESELEQRLRMEEATRQAHMAEQDEVLRLEKQAAVTNRQAALARMTESQRESELRRERSVLVENLKGTDPEDIGTMMMKNRLAEVNLALATKEGHNVPGPLARSLPGAFVGGYQPNPVLQSTRELLAEMRKTNALLAGRGIVIRDIVR